MVDWEGLVMNKERRKRLDEIFSNVEQIKFDLEAICDEALSSIDAAKSN